MSALGVAVGWPLALDLLVWTVVAGGVLSVVALISAGRLLRALKGYLVSAMLLLTPGAAVPGPASKVRMPLGAGIAAAVVVVAAFPDSRILTDFVIRLG